MAYFIADIASNHDGKLSRAKELIKLTKEAGCNAAKFQSFSAENLVSEKGSIGLKIAHQKDWKQSVYETYKKYSIPLDWIKDLADECKKNEIDFMCTPYDMQSLEEIDKYVTIHKIGSGDINYYQLLQAVAKKKKLVLLGTGASTLEEVINAANVIMAVNPALALLQCNTNYENKTENMYYSDINVIKSYKLYFPGIMTGISDHTKSIKPALACIALGGEFIEKHLTDGKSDSPDNEFALGVNEWRYLISECKEMFKVMGNNYKLVEKNEVESRVIQRRCIRAAHVILKGTEIKETDIVALRPAPDGSILPFINIKGKKVNKEIAKGDVINIEDLI